MLKPEDKWDLLKVLSTHQFNVDYKWGKQTLLPHYKLWPINGGIERSIIVNFLLLYMSARLYNTGFTG